MGRARSNSIYANTKEEYLEQLNMKNSPEEKNKLKYLTEKEEEEVEEDDYNLGLDLPFKRIQVRRNRRA